MILFFTYSIAGTSRYSGVITNLGKVSFGDADELIDYLLSADVERQLAQSAAVQIPLHAGVQGPKNIPAIETFKPMTLDYTKAATRVEDVTGRLAGILGL